jgi:hypothetical protein
MHKQYVHIGFIVHLVTEECPPDIAIDICERCFKALTCAGLLHFVANDIFEVHPRVGDLLEECQPASEGQKRALVRYATEFAKHRWAMGLDAARKPLWFYGATLKHAVVLAEALGMEEQLFARCSAAKECGTSNAVRFVGAVQVSLPNLAPLERMGFSELAFTMQDGVAFRVPAMWFLFATARDLLNDGIRCGRLGGDQVSGPPRSQTPFSRAKPHFSN